jgi:hypothetical protein
MPMHFQFIPKERIYVWTEFEAVEAVHEANQLADGVHYYVDCVRYDADILKENLYQMLNASLTEQAAGRTSLKYFENMRPFGVGVLTRSRREQLSTMKINPIMYKVELNKVICWGNDVIDSAGYYSLLAMKTSLYLCACTRNMWKQHRRHYLPYELKLRPTMNEFLVKLFSLQVELIHTSAYAVVEPTLNDTLTEVQWVFQSVVHPTRFIIHYDLLADAYTSEVEDLLSRYGHSRTP